MSTVPAAPWGPATCVREIATWQHGPSSKQRSGRAACLDQMWRQLFQAVKNLEEGPPAGRGLACRRHAGRPRRQGAAWGGGWTGRGGAPAAQDWGRPALHAHAPVWLPGNRSVSRSKAVWLLGPCFAFAVARQGAPSGPARARCSTWAACLRLASSPSARPSRSRRQKSPSPRSPAQRGSPPAVVVHGRPPLPGGCSSASQNCTRRARPSRRVWPGAPSSSLQAGGACACVG